MSSAPPKIDILPEHLIDQIKAGEVIERPGNLLKEILENAVDAGSTKIELTLKNNGLDLISLKDNGHGMRYDDLPLAFSRHATSKIGRFEDLYRLNTYGFRGEALASIASISRLQCVTYAAGEGAEIKIEGGATLYHGKRMDTASSGTELVIQDLFYNTPVRLKFIQSQNSEKQFIRKVLFAFILSNPKIEFQIKIDDEDKEIFMPAANAGARIQDLLPKYRDHLLNAEKYYEDNELALYLLPGHAKTLKGSPSKWQYVFINGRFVLDKQFHRVTTNALQHTFGSDDFHYLAFFRLPSDNIDVNVHPNKTIIKCFESSKLMALLTSTVRELAASKRSTPAAATPVTEAPTPQGLFETPDFMPSLSQERHEYNMEGFFSPHNISREEKPFLSWIGDEHFLRELDGKYFAYSARRLLQKYTEAMLSSTAPSIPLLVSEPYPKKKVQSENLKRLIEAGLELEHLGQDTIVLRAIPEWMNGFPLRDIVTCLLHGEDFSQIKLNAADWSTSTWEVITNAFGLDELIQQKICVDLSQLLKDKLR